MKKMLTVLVMLAIVASMSFAGSIELEAETVTDLEAVDGTTLAFTGDGSQALVGPLTALFTFEVSGVPMDKDAGILTALGLGISADFAAVGTFEAIYDLKAADITVDDPELSHTLTITYTVTPEW